MRLHVSINRRGQPAALHATREDYAGFVTRRVDTMYVVLRASNHSEFAYTGPDQPAPAAPSPPPGTRTYEPAAMIWRLPGYVPSAVDGAGSSR